MFVLDFCSNSTIPKSPALSVLLRTLQYEYHYCHYCSPALLKALRHSAFDSNAILIFADLDVDSQTDGVNPIMSGLDTDSDSDIGDAGLADVNDVMQETPYVLAAEEVFGEVREPSKFCIALLSTDFKII